ncbi:hypothetical protein ACP275_09G109400 [Erythranthe tilingii]
MDTDTDLIPGLPEDVGLECLVRIHYNHFSSVSSVSKSWRRQLHLPEFWRRRRAAGFTRQVIVLAQSRVDPTRDHMPKKYAAAPVYRLTLCEPETGIWAELPSIPGYSGGLPMFCQVVGVGLDLVVVGGCDPVTWEVSNSVFIYNFATATWRSGAYMPGGPRLFFACASDSLRRVFVAGGHDNDKRALRTAMAYDVAGDVWSAMPDMATERDEAKGIFHAGIFHIVGGYRTDMQGQFETSTESFDAATWQWGPVREDFLDGPTTCTGNCDIAVQGGDVAAREGSTWRVVADMPSEVRNITAYVATWRGKVLVIGSEGFGGAYKTFVLDLKSGKWERVEAGDDFLGHVQSGCCMEL